jgi:triacylglycerol lipase
MVRRVAALVLALVALGGTASASHQAGHNEPVGPARARFPSAFPKLVDREWGFRLGGFGGRLWDDADYGVRHPVRPEKHHPVIFVHGNTVDHADWYPVRAAFIAAGWSASDLWAISYNGVGSQNGTDGTTNPRRDDEHIAYPGYDFGARITNNSLNSGDLHAFTLAVLKYRKAKRFSIVSHSLGVTVARHMLKRRPELRKQLVSFVGIAGGNHGTSLCPPGSEQQLMSCDEVAKDTAWLAKLNGKNGVDEAYGPARFLTVYDGSGMQDAAFIGPDYAESPRLHGAVNCEVEDQHNDLRIAPTNIDIYRTFIEAAERGLTDKNCM